jgi:NAD(P)H-hydrate epimerase
MRTYDYATRDEIRAFDRHAIDKLGIPGIVLMENAGRQIAETAAAMIEDLPRPRALILAGRGNNGGDAFVVARHLLRRDGAILDVVLLGPRDAVQGDARTNLEILDALGVAVTTLDGAAESIVGDVRGRLARADLVVDGLLGTGTRGQVREPYAGVIAAVNAAGKRVLAIDIPSGLDCDTGRPLGPTIRAARTVTMAALKVGFQDPDAAPYTGEVVLADIGVPFRRGV